MVGPAFGLDAVQPSDSSSKKPRPTESEFDVLHRYYRDDKEATKNQHYGTLGYGSKNERSVVLSNETGKGAKAATIRGGRFRQLDASRNMDAR